MTTTLSSRVCSRCGVDISHRDARSRHCSPRCRDRDYEGSVIGTTRSCAHCATPFKPTKNPHIYCSRACGSRADLIKNRAAYNRRNGERRARQRQAQVGESFDRVDVFNRDGWICQLCLAPINWNLTGRQPLAPSLDHILPLSKGGTHTWDNVQAAHFSCNAAKQSRTDVILLPVPGSR